MIRTVIALVALLIAGLCSTAHAQDETTSRPSLMGSNSEGLHFMVGFMQNEIKDGLQWCTWESAYQSIQIGSRYPATVTITMPDGIVIDTSVRAFEVLAFTVDPRFECIGEGIFRNAVEIVSSAPVSVTCFSSKNQTSDGYLALPVSSWGTKYVSANYYVDHYAQPDDFCATHPRPGEFAIICAQDSTTVTVVPSTRTLEGMAPGATHRRVLRRGEIFQVQDGGTERRSAWAPGSDITGSVITADKPVGLLSGHVRAGITSDYQSKDHLIEMLPPLDALGTRYMTVPFLGRQGGDLLRITAASALPTTVTTTSLSNGLRTTTMTGLGAFVDVDIFDAVVIDASRPILVTQYSRSAGADPRNADTDSVHFDPDMVVLSPMEQFVDGGVFATPANDPSASGRPRFTSHRVSIVAERRGLASVRLNGRLLSSNSTYQSGAMPDSSYRWASVEIPGNSTFYLSGSARFAGYLYGLGRYDSYAWPVGSRAQRLSPIEDGRRARRDLDPR